MTDMERHDPDTGERIHVFTAWKREYHWRYEVRPSLFLGRYIAWDKKKDKQVIMLRSRNDLSESTAIATVASLNQAYLELYRHKVEILVA